MDDYFFEGHVRSCTEVEEATSFLQIFNYSNGEVYYDKGALPMSEFDNFIEQKGVFEPPKPPAGAQVLNGMRLILQLGAKNPHTFTTEYISFTHDQYIRMVRGLHLPFRAIESTSVVGPFFWSGMDDADDDDANNDPHLQIVFRKSDVRKKGLTRGWELMLSHAMRTGMTTGFAKGTASSDLDRTIDVHLYGCRRHAGHPLLLPTVILCHELDASMDDRQRLARHELRRLENAITARDEIRSDEGYSIIQGLDAFQHLLVDCHSKVLWKRPESFLDTLDEAEKTLTLFQEERKRLLETGRIPNTPQSQQEQRQLDRLHRNMLARFHFFRQKLKGVRHYAQTTLARLDVQRSALYHFIAQRESKLNLETAHHQRLLALASKRDSQSMKALSIVGAVFLPATYLASLFSMTFFDFQDNNNNNGDGNNNQPKSAVAPTLWIYFAITIPVTCMVLAALFWWDKKREKKFADEESQIEQEQTQMEMRVVTNLREKKTTGLNSMDTKRWDTM